MEENQVRMIDLLPKRPNQFTVAGSTVATTLPFVINEQLLNQLFVKQGNSALQSAFGAYVESDQGLGCRWLRGVLFNIFNFGSNVAPAPNGYPYLNYASAQASANFTIPLPPYSRISWAELMPYTNLTFAGGAAAVGIGTSGSPSSALKSSSAIKNNITIAGASNDNSAVSTATTLQVAAVNSGGSAAGTVQGAFAALVVVEFVTPLMNHP